MLKASRLFDETQKKQVEEAVIEAELKTSCEIVPVVATASGRYDRSEDIIGLWLVTLSTLAFWLLFPRQGSESGSWGTVPLYIEILTIIASTIIMFMLGVMLGSQFYSLRRMFVPKKQMEEEVALRAREAFFDNRIHHTEGSTGILIYVSLFEHIAMVLGDESILSHPELGQPFLDDLCHQLTQKLHNGEITEAICETVAEAGKRLSGPLPRMEGDVNELHDALVLID